MKSSDPLAGQPIPDPDHHTGEKLPSAGPGPCLDSRQLFRGGQQLVEIIHGEVRYFLRLTQANKLILTK